MCSDGTQVNYCHERKTLAAGGFQNQPTMEVFVFLKNTSPETLEEIKKVKIDELGMFQGHKKVKIYPLPNYEAA